MSWSQSVADDDIAAELASSLPPEEAEALLRGVAAAAAVGRSAPARARRRAGQRLPRPGDLREAAARARPVTLAGEQVLPVLPALQPLLAAGGLVRGTTTSVGDPRGGNGSGATSLALALVAEASAAGSWVAAVGLPDLGLAAAAEAGVSLDRLAVVHRPEPDSWAMVVAALVGAFDIVLVDGDRRVRAADARRLAARGRERGTVLIEVHGPDRGRPVARRGPEPDLRLVVTHAEWSGAGTGHGTLRARRVAVEADGRRQAARPRRAVLWLPDERGVVTSAPTPAAWRDHGLTTGRDAMTGTGGPDRVVAPVRSLATGPERLAG